jgi:hypothetical protein
MLKVDRVSILFPYLAFLNFLLFKKIKNLPTDHMIVHARFFPVALAISDIAFTLVIKNVSFYSRAECNFPKK